MFCPSANLISPKITVKATAKGTNDISNVHRKAPTPALIPGSNESVILEKDAETGSTYLHLVMPATAVNFLNGMDSSSIFDFVNRHQTSTNQSSNSYEDMHS